MFWGCQEIEVCQAQSSGVGNSDGVVSLQGAAGGGVDV